MNKFMKVAIEQAKIGICNNEGGPFGSVIVKDGEIIGQGHNQVLLKSDPTCHGEIQAIRDACKNLNSYDLSGCEIYTTGEPCPMCLSACMWANISKVYYGCTLADNESIGFRDKKFFNLLGNKSPILKDYLECTDRDECQKLFTEYAKKENIIY